MRLPRITIRSLLGVVSLIAIGIAALRAADDLWDSGMLGLTVLGLMTAVPLAVHRTDGRRAYWLGFALFGWAYLVASLSPQIGPRLPTTMGLAFIDSKIPGREATTSAVFSYTASPVFGYTSPFYTLPTTMQGNAWIWDLTTGNWVPGPASTTENFIRIGHSLLALLLAFVGGLWSRYLYGQGRRESVVPHRELPGRD
jgi:hypothetical protein